LEEQPLSQIAPDLDQASAPPEQTPTKPKRPALADRRSFMREALETILLIAAIYTLVNLATSRYVVEGHSMLPTFQGDEYLIVNRMGYMFDDPERGDIVIFHYPEDPTRDFIKRVIGLPGDYIRMENGVIFVNDVPIAEPYVLEWNYAIAPTAAIVNGTLARMNILCWVITEIPAKIAPVLAL
jgi:signal peptidase I